MQVSIRDATLGAKIRRARVAVGLTQKELGDQIGLGPDAISLYEKGNRNISWLTLRKLARALERPLNYFIDLGDDVVIVKGTQLYAIVIAVQAAPDTLRQLYEIFQYLLFKRNPKHS